MDANTTKLSLSELLAKGYCRGSILRCRMRNFLTYDDAEVFPGPKLNVLLGPNGTGKSAITHAICLACAGAPSTLGRSNDLTEFVKRGKEHENIAFVEVDLFNPTDEHYRGADRTKFVVTVRRIINHETKGSKYTYNKRASTQREVKTLMQELNIDVDNLCSFMPQDRVGEFAKYSPSEMLHNTLKTISCPSSLAVGAGNDANEDENLDGSGTNVSNLYEVQMKLANEEITKRRLDADKQNKEMEVEKYRKKLKELEPDIKREEKRQALQQILELYQVKKGLLKVEESKANRAVKQREVEAAEQALQDNQMLIEPLIKKERDSRLQVALAEKHHLEFSKKCSGTNTKIIANRENVNKCESNLESIRQEILSIAQRALRLEDDLKKFKEDEVQLKASYDQALNTVENANIPQKMQELMSQSKVLNHSCEKTREEIHDLHQHRTDLQQEIGQGRKQLDKFQDPRRIFINRLYGCRESYKTKQAVGAMSFMIQNEDRLRQEGKLRGAVYGPIAYYCNVENPVCAAMLENSMTTYKWMNFVVTCNEDKKVLKQEFIKNNYKRIDIAVVPDTRELVNRLNQSRNELNRLNVYDSLGVKGLLVDAIECPDSVKMFLMTHGGLSNVYWSSNVENNLTIDKYLFKNMDERILKTLLGNKQLVRLYIYNKLANTSKIIHYNINKSRFGNDYTGYNDNIEVSASILMKSTSTGNEDGGRDALIEKLKNIENELSLLDKEMISKNKEANNFQTNITRLKDEMSKLNSLKQQPDRVKIQLNLCRNKIRDVETKMNGDYGDSESKQKIKEYKACVQKLFNMINASLDYGYMNINQSVDKTIYDKIKIELTYIQENIKQELHNARSRIDKLKDCVDVAIENRRISIRELEINLAAIQEVEDALNMEGKGNYNSLVELVFTECGPLIPPEIPIPLVNSLNRKIPDTYCLDDVDIQIENISNEIKSSIENPLILQQFNDTRDKLKYATEELERISTEFVYVNTALTDRMDDWKTKVYDVINKLDILFSDYMSRLGYSGNIIFVAIGKITEYKITMKVSYRENENVVELTSSRQSGGEKSVATIMYLMALQGLTASPFRVVDEINQGMDERNERLVVDRVVDSCCIPAALGSNMPMSPIRGRTLSNEQNQRFQKMKMKPQYFLVSPKLLEALSAIDHPDVTVLMVWNGPGVLQNTWQITDIIKNLITYCDKNQIRIQDGILNATNVATHLSPVSSNFNSSRSPVNSNSNNTLSKRNRKRPMSDITNSNDSSQRTDTKSNEKLTPSPLSEVSNSFKSKKIKTPTFLATANDTPTISTSSGKPNPNHNANPIPEELATKSINIKSEFGHTNRAGKTVSGASNMNLYSNYVVDLSQDTDSDVDIIVID